MKVFVYEHITGGGMTGMPLLPGLVREADMMVRALLDNLAAIPGVATLASRDPRLPALPGVEPLTARPGESPAALFARVASAADAVWPTAPETDGVLEQLARATLALDRILLGCRPEAVRLAASKHATALALAAVGIPVVPTFARSDALPPLPGPWAVKPDDGAGCDGLRRVTDWRAARDCLERDAGRLVAQPWLEGEAMSLSLLCRDGRARLLACNRQHLRLTDGVPTLARLSVNAMSDGDGRLAALASSIAAVIPGLWGYVGVDLVRGPAGPVVLEVNPRLTTSCCGLRAALGVNVAELVLSLLVPDAALPGAATAPGKSVELSLEPSLAF